MARVHPLSSLLAGVVLCAGASAFAASEGSAQFDERTDGALVAGYQHADGKGGELSVLCLTRKRGAWSGPGLSARGWGLVAGATGGSGYVEGEGVLIPGWRLPHWSGSGPLSLVLTGGGGPVVRWRDGAAGVQATFSATWIAVPVMLFVRPRAFLSGGTDVVVGFMFKLPLMAPD